MLQDYVSSMTTNWMFFVGLTFVAVVLWHRQPSGEPPILEAQHAEDMELLADSEALELLDGWDGPFYEWATAQTDNVESG